MNRLALTRLALGNDAPAWRRRIGLVLGVALGVALFLTLLGAFFSLAARTERATILGGQGAFRSGTEIAQLGPDEVAVTRDLDTFDNRPIERHTIAATPDTTVTAPGIKRLPGPGEYLASPALQELIAATPADQLGDRFGTPVGVLPPDVLEGPDALVALVGMSPEQMSTSGNSARVVHELVGSPYASQAYRVIALIGAISVLIPALVLAAIVTNLGAARRAERLAVLRLIGATPTQVATLAATEMAGLAALGSAAGIGLHLAVLPLVSRFRLETAQFYPHDLTATWQQMLGALVGVTLAAAAVAWWRTRRADVGPLGSSRERQERRPHPASLVPMLLGIAGLAVSAAVGNQLGAGTIGPAVVGSAALVMLGLLWCGPWLTWLVARGAARFSGSAATVVASNRVRQHPRASFRAVSGLVVALFCVTVFAVGITSAAEPTTREDSLPSGTLVAELPGDAEELATRLAGIDGVRVVRGFHTGDPAEMRMVVTRADAAALGLELDTAFDGAWVSFYEGWLSGIDSADPLVAPPPGSVQDPTVVILTQGPSVAEARVRTLLWSSASDLGARPITLADFTMLSGFSADQQFRAAAIIGILIAGAISAVSLGISTTVSVVARARMFGLLRLTGMPSRVLRRTVAVEALLPVATTMVVAVAAGAYTAWAVVSALSVRTLGWPDPSSYLILAICLVLVAGAILATSRAADRLTAEVSTRFE
ncbi:MAG: FtsX-like permease family protein [Propionibacteriaceae bacterium]|nr:FtsX-like permease family protein [Propionibacteriaceae bacterium]